MKHCLLKVISLLNLQKEHMAIRQKKRPDDPIDYDDYKSMRFTLAVLKINY